jgi:tetratricopeptide (TPR) repeat protein
MIVEQLSSLYREAVRNVGAGELGRAKAAFEEILSKDAALAQYPNIFRWLGIIDFSLQNFESACQYFIEAISKMGERGSDNDFLKFPLDHQIQKEEKEARAWTYHDLGYCLLADGKYEEAKAWLELAIPETLEKGTKKWFYNDLGYYYYKIKNYNNSYIYHSLALKLDPEDPYTRNFLGLTHYKKLDFDAASSEFEEALNILQRRLGLSSSIARDGETRLNEELKSLPKDHDRYAILLAADILTNMSRIEIDKRDDDFAESLLKKAKMIYGVNWQWIEMLVPIRIRTMKENLSAIHNNFGLISYKQGIGEKAKAEYEKALELAKLAQYYYNLGILFKDEGQREKAKKQFTEAYRLDPTLTDAKAYLDSIEEAKGSDWWRWWFGGDSEPRKYVGVALIAFSAFMFADLLYLSILSQGITQINRTINLTKNITTQTETISQVSMESRLIITALLIFILILPQIKSFSAKDLSFELEPMSKGASGQDSKA